MTTSANIKCKDCGWWSRGGEDHECQWPPLWSPSSDPALRELEHALQWGLNHVAQHPYEEDY